MATALVGGAFLSASLDVLFDRLASPQIADLILGKKLDPKLLQRLETTLRVVRAMLNDAEKKQITDSNVSNWLEDLKDAVYLADDLLDEVSTKAVTEKEVSTTNLFSRLFNKQDREMVSRLEEIVVRLESILKLKESLNLKEIAMDCNLSYRAPSTSLEDGSRIYGRDEDKEAIMKLLLDDSTDDGEVSVIPIVGMGGVGKTTLAQLVYNDENTNQKFNFKAWVCVSKEFDILKVTKAITEAVTGSTCNMNDLNLLHLDLRNKLKEKKFLIVLDDVWIEDYFNWNLLKKPFQLGIRGSKILVTTRSEKVASVVQTVQTYKLKQLSNEDCWLVFANHACLSSEFSQRTTTLEKIGREIVKKCKGLPLAAQSLGGMLRRKRDIRDWNNVLNSDIWELSESENIIIPALRISYYYLPPHLKRCFVYCSLYPKDYEFHKDDLVLLWMAEDLLPQLNKGKTMEEVGYEYFDYLVSRSFFQRSSNTWMTSFVMHDLIHDLAISLGGEFFFRSDELGRGTKISIKTRHLSFYKYRDPVLENFEVFGRVKFLRTLSAILTSEVIPFDYEGPQCMVLSKLKHLRVLSLCRFPNLVALPDSLGELIHLRYLNLSMTNIKTLPESLGNLYNLQTLMLHACHMLIKLPAGMQNLVNLRHLEIGSTSIKEMPRGMGKLNQLQYLSTFIVGQHKENGIKQLGGLSNLHGSLHISKLENVTNGNEAMEARVKDKKHIDSLFLGWSTGGSSTDSQIEIDILDKLQPHQDLKLLSISGYRGTKFPDWVGNSSYHIVTDLSLYSCKNCCMLPSLGQLPSLKNLTISNLDGLETIDAGFYKIDDSSSVTPFPSLESLSFYNMRSWEVWSLFESDAFPQLKHLKIKHCPRLRADLPNQLLALETLTIECCEQLVSSLPRAPVIRKLEILKSNKVSLREFPLLLESITILGNPIMVESIFETITNTQPTCLKSLRLTDCLSAVSFPGSCLPTSLKTLQVWNMKKLEFPKQHKHGLLDSLSINNSCESLTSLPLENFPNLDSLYIENCENLKSLSASQSQPLQNLSYFEIRECHNFISFPREGLPAPTMTLFIVSDCNKLKSLPNQMNTLLPMLERLQVQNCPEIDSFPEGGMPPNLRSICITNCEKLLSGLASMDMLTHVTIAGPFDGIKSFPEEGLLPASLTSLELHSFSHLHTLDCKGLRRLTSLQQLTIRYCPKLQNITGERLPSSLIGLQIYGCPLLKEQCHMKHPHVWPKISQISDINVDGSYFVI